MQNSYLKYVKSSANISWSLLTWTYQQYVKTEIFVPKEVGIVGIIEWFNFWSDEWYSRSTEKDILKVNERKLALKYI